MNSSVRLQDCFLFDCSAHLERYIFAEKPHLNRFSGSKVMSNWMILRTIEIHSFIWLCLTINAPDFPDSARSQHIWCWFLSNLLSAWNCYAIPANSWEVNLRLRSVLLRCKSASMFTSCKSAITWNCYARVSKKLELPQAKGIN